jgi:predicted nucleotidyltransferase
MSATPKRWWEVRKKGWWRAFRNIPVFWMHQRTTYMDKTELFFYLILSLIFTLLLYFILYAHGLFSSQWARILAAAIGARTLTYLFNDHFWGGLLVSFGFIKNCGRKNIRKYLIDSQRRISRCDSIHTYNVYGSLVRGEFHSKSDLDVRYIRRPGIMNGLAATSFAAKERVIAFLRRIPLDSFVGDNVEFLDKMRSDEIPIVIKDDEAMMAKKYKKYVPFDKFLRNFIL